MRRIFSGERVLITGVCVSVVAGLVFAIWTSVPVGLGVCVALLGTIVSLQLDLSLRVERRSRRDDEAGRLLTALDSAGEFLPLFIEAAESAAKAIALPAGERLELARRVRENLIPLVRAIKELERGRVHQGPSRTDMLLDQLRLTRHSLRTVTFFGAGTANWWQSDTGTEYWQVNLSIMRDHGVKTERIFLCDERTEEVIAFAKAQAREGVHVRIAELNAVPPELQIRFGIFDEVIVHTVVYSSAGRDVEYVYSADPADTVQAVDRFEILRALAKPIEVSTSSGPAAIADINPSSYALRAFRRFRPTRTSAPQLEGPRPEP
jgi:hypothetical protein